MRGVQVEYINPPAPPPPRQDGVVRTLPPSRSQRGYFVIETRSGERSISLDGDARIVPDLKARGPQVASRLQVSVLGDARIISEVAAGHVVIVDGITRIEFEPVRGANVELINGVVTGAYRVKITDA